MPTIVWFVQIASLPLLLAQVMLTAILVMVFGFLSLRAGRVLVTGLQSRSANPLCAAVWSFVNMWPKVFPPAPDCPARVE